MGIILVIQVAMDTTQRNVYSYSARETEINSLIYIAHILYQLNCEAGIVHILFISTLHV